MKKIIFALVALGFITVSCKKDKKDDVPTPTNPNEEELITSFYITFEDANGVLPDVTAAFVDIDGPGGNAPTTFDTIRLVNNTTYNATITLLNESVSPADDITVEVQAEGVDHLFCFDVTNGLNLSIAKTDLDANNLPIGLSSQWITTGASTGTTTIRLKHQPGIKTGDCALGDTDIELVFETEVQ